MSSEVKRKGLKKKERVVQTYLIICTLLLAYNQNILVVQNPTTNNTIHSQTDPNSSNYILQSFIMFIFFILVYNAGITLPKNKILKVNAINYCAVISSSCFTSIIIYYIVMQNNIAPAHFSVLVNNILSSFHFLFPSYLLYFLCYTQFIFRSYFALRNQKTKKDLKIKKDPLAEFIVTFILFFIINTVVQHEFTDNQLFFYTYFVLMILAFLPLLLIPSWIPLVFKHIEKENFNGFLQILKLNLIKDIKSGLNITDLLSFILIIIVQIRYNSIFK